MMRENEELKELMGLVNQFIDYARNLKREGKITEEQYKAMTKNKIEFLESVAEEKQVYKVEGKEKDLFY